MSKKLVIIALLFCAKQVDAQVCFTPQTNYPVVNGASSVTSADFNGDAKLDLAVANNGSDNVSVLLGDGAGNFGAATNFSAGTNPYGICSADFNGDGFKDIAVSNHGSNNVSILLGTGSGSFGAPANFSVGTGPVSIATADFDGDGKADVATANFASNDVSVLLGDGLGGFGSATSYTVGSTTTAPNPHSVIALDLNLDGKPDLVTANYGSNNISILHGTGAGVFSAPINYAVVASSTPFAVIAADLDGDGKVDLATANAATSNVSVLLQKTGVLNVDSFKTTPAITLPTGGTGVVTNTSGITSGDFNADGKQDIAIANNATDEVTLLLSTVTTTVSSSSFPISATFDLTSGAGPNAVINGDFNGDGKPDLATANWGTSESTVLINAPLPAITITAQAAAVCKGVGDTLTAYGGVSYVWAPAASLSCGTCSVTVTSNTVTTTKTYTVTGTDANGCTNKATQLVTLNALPVITVTATPNPVCKGLSCTLTAGGAVTYTCNNPGIYVGAPFVPTATTTYTVSGTDANGCIGKATKTVTVTPVVIAKPKYDTLCLGGSSFIVASGASTYTWTSNATGNNDTVFIAPTTTATYVVSGTDASGCTNTTAAVVTVVDSAAGTTVNPKVTATAKEDTLCAGGTAKIVAKNAATYTWTSVSSINNYTVDVNNDTISVSPTSTTIYTVTGKDARNCKNKTTATVTVLTGSHPNYPKLVITPQTDTLCNGSSTIIVIKGAATYTWTSGATGNNDTAFVAPSVTTSYVVSGTNLGNCTNTIATQIVVMDTSSSYCHIGIKEITNMNAIKIYPNPNNGSFVIDANNSEKLVLRVFDLSGKVVLSQIITDKTTVNANSLNEGIYIVNLSGSEGVINKRLVIVR